MRLFSLCGVLLVASGCQPAKVDTTIEPATPGDSDPPVVVEPEPEAPEPRQLAIPTVVDVGLSSRVQATALGSLQRGRACVVADQDRDGRPDLYIGNPGDISYTLRNLTTTPGELLFDYPVALFEGELAWAASAADVDNDGDLDLFISNGGNEGRGFDKLLKNQLQESGEARFEDVTPTAGLAGSWSEAQGRMLEAASANGVWGDADNDGDLDLYVSVNIVGRDDSHPLAGRNLLWLNDGTGSFHNVAPELGLDVHKGKSRHSTWFDFDNDGDLDLYENNYRSSNHLWVNTLETGTLGFFDGTAAAAALGADLGQPYRSFASAAGDFNNDGWTDLIVFSRGVTGGDCADVGTVEDGIEGDWLFLNLGPGRGMVEVANIAGLNVDILQRDVPMGGLGVMGSQLGDINSDGLLDVFIGNGGPETGEANQLFAAREVREVEIEGVGTVAVPFFDDWSHLIDVAAPQTDDPAIFYPPYPYRTHGACIADLDADGLPELTITNGGPEAWPDDVREPDRVFSFQFPEGSRPDGLHVALEGDGDQVTRDGVGARIVVTALREDGSEITVHRTLYGGSAFSGQNGLDVHLGLGFAEAITSVQVTWPDGTVQQVEGEVALNQTLRVIYPQ